MNEELKEELRKATWHTDGYRVALCTKRKIRKLSAVPHPTIDSARNAARRELLTETKKISAVITNGREVFLEIPNRK